MGRRPCRFSFPAPVPGHRRGFFFTPSRPTVTTAIRWLCAGSRRRTRLAVRFVFTNRRRCSTDIYQLGSYFPLAVRRPSAIATPSPLYQLPPVGRWCMRVIFALRIASASCHAPRQCGWRRKCRCLPRRVHGSLGIDDVRRFGLMIRQLHGALRGAAGHIAAPLRRCMDRSPTRVVSHRHDHRPGLRRHAIGRSETVFLLCTRGSAWRRACGERSGCSAHSHGGVAAGE